MRVTLDDIRAREQQHVLQTYKRQPVVFVRGEGSRLFDENGKSYLDFLSHDVDQSGKSVETAKPIAPSGVPTSLVSSTASPPLDRISASTSSAGAGPAISLSSGTP